VTRAEIVESSLIPAYDAMTLGHVRTWRYEPYVIDGVATPVCANVRIKFGAPPATHSTPLAKPRARTFGG
jgi:outer membrane biosynthesis protein TonB